VKHWTDSWAPTESIQPIYPVFAVCRSVASPVTAIHWWWARWSVDKLRGDGGW